MRTSKYSMKKTEKKTINIHNNSEGYLVHTCKPADEAKKETK